MSEIPIEKFAWLILFLPLVSVALISLIPGIKSRPRVSAQISIAAVVVCFLLTSILYFVLQNSGQQQFPQITATWLQVDYLRIDIGLKLDALSMMMMLIVTGVGGLIHIFSWEYMKGDPGYSRYFACLSLFIFSMLGIVMADNFLMMFIFWELVGISSYLLIGFWYERPSAADACKKAFLTNRLGDFGFLVGILLVWATLGHRLNFDALKQYLDKHTLEFAGVATAAGLLVFCGAAGKSAQFPLHVWLPDAMEGPTPVSALIHAATMVAAGVYMLCRIYFLLDVSGSHALEVIAWIGGITALLAAVIAIQQNDIKRILAYSTLSQLGYMVMAVGTHGPTPAMFHLTTHAFFKALLFLGAGAVIHAVHHEQNIWKMGALRKKMPTTFVTFTIGTLALAGCPPLSGFYSKDGILGQAMETHHYGLFILGLLAAILTTFYMFRLVFVAFYGAPRSEAADHAHEAPGMLKWPLIILAVFSFIGGVIGIEGVYGKFFEPEKVEHVASWVDGIMAPINDSPLAAAFGILAFLAGIAAAFAFYWNKMVDPLPEKLGFLSRLMRNKFYFDEFYEHVLIPCTQEALAKLANGIDRWIIGGFMVRGTQGTTEFIGRALRLVQTGSLQTYAFLLVAGVALVLYLILAR
ncbi:NADH-quinone oxidoreductase subunit L [Pedosphaera parvula]|uniref:Proton-translocating NADH-quinone oxidoreductase, chain L n=1 Tax=Pedosphaera parvula (strain Ellin514) TaxID=320771 RepID=B9XHI6_PEDPL|nr:NADH-quinone oxidoreductase subunit L [Pedosphaera parvula]EEF60821.1 proton-translocating NADH-quinone oxidoreductase, chain L [Pedosphaera parvula Ellin514]